jgi:hypothetical protein
MIRKDYKWPSTRERAKKERARAMSQAFFLSASIVLSCGSIAVLIPEGNWIALAGLAIGAASTSAAITRFFN